MKLSENIAKIVWAFPSGDSRCNDIRELSARVFAMERLLLDLRCSPCSVDDEHEHAGYESCLGCRAKKVLEDVEFPL